MSYTHCRIVQHPNTSNPNVLYCDRREEWARLRAEDSQRWEIAKLIKVLDAWYMTKQKHIELFGEDHFDLVFIQDCNDRINELEWLLEPVMSGPPNELPRLDNNNVE